MIYFKYGKLWGTQYMPFASGDPQLSSLVLTGPFTVRSFITMCRKLWHLSSSLFKFPPDRTNKDNNKRQIVTCIVPQLMLLEVIWGTITSVLPIAKRVDETEWVGQWLQSRYRPHFWSSFPDNCNPTCDFRGLQSRNGLQKMSFPSSQINSWTTVVRKWPAKIEIQFRDCSHSTAPAPAPPKLWSELHGRESPSVGPEA